MQRSVRRRGVGLSDIAKAVGVTEGTASRALNNYPDIAESTRAKVAEAARLMNYRPSPSARRLARGTVESIGYILPAHAPGQTDPFLSQMLDGISQALSLRDWDLLVTTVGSPDREIETYERLVESGKVSGLIITRTLSHDPRVEFMKSADVPFVVHGRTAEPDGYAWLDIDNELAFANAVAHLYDLGHRRIGLISAGLDYNFSRLRIAGYRQGISELGLDSTDGLIVNTDLSPGGGRKAAARLLECRHQPTAIICINDAVAIGAMRAAQERGFVVGQDISVIGYDGLPIGEYTDPPLTTMTQDVMKTGMRLTEILLAILDGAQSGEFHEIWQARLVTRASDGPAPPIN